MTSSTRLYASKEAVADPDRKKVIDDFVLLIHAVLQARIRVMMDLNVQQKDLDAVLAALPSLRTPDSFSAFEFGLGCGSVRDSA